MAVMTAPPIISFCESYQLYEVDVCQKQKSSLSKLYSNYEEFPEFLLDEADVDKQFYHKFCYISWSHDRIFWISKSSNRNNLATKMFYFWDPKA